MRKGIIVYYVVGPVHLRNLELISQQMPNWDFRVAYEANVPWFTSKQMNNLGYDVVPLIDDHIPVTLWNGNVRVIIFSSVQLRQTPVSLLKAALLRGIPTVAIEETSQIALNNGRINNYLLPVEHLLVASKHERNGMIAGGVPKQHVEVTGWPFYTGQVGKNESNLVREKKAQFGFDIDRPVASLTLTALGDAGESPDVRRRQLSLAAQGLPKKYQLAVKPHPIEPLEKLAPFVRDYAPQAKIIPGNVPISDLLSATDVLLNRGVSQVCFEALLQEIPVIVLDTGIQTPFHKLVSDELFISDSSDLAKTLEIISGVQNVMQLYESFMAKHLPFTPEQSLNLTCKKIAEIASQNEKAGSCETQWFHLALYQSWLHEPNEALSILSQCQEKISDTYSKPLIRLIQYKATIDDLTILKNYLGNGFHQSILQSLWIYQLTAQGGKPADQELKWIQNFPPTTNTSWFMPLTQQWAAILIRSNKKKELQLFIKRLEREFTHEQGINVLTQYLKDYQKNLYGRIKYYVYIMGLKFRKMLRPILSKFSILLDKFRRKNDLRKELSG